MNRIFKWMLILLSLSLIAVPVTYAAYLYQSTKSAIDTSYNKAYEKSQLRDKAINPSVDNFSILFLGIDDSPARRDNGQKTSEARTDSMILATFNRDDKQVRLIGIPRDTLSYIPSVKMYDKITHAHAEGGPESSAHAVEQKFNVPVDYYVRVNMQAFIDVVDELGGIEFDVPFDIDEPTKNDHGRIKIKKGRRLLNGNEALALARSRRVDTDLGRGKRQMEMIIALAKKAKDSDSISKLDELVEIVGNNAKHNLTFNDISAMAQYYSSNDVKFKQRQLKGTDYMYNGVYYYNPVMEDVYDISKLLHKDLELKMIEEDELLDYQVRALYYDLIPLMEIDRDEIQDAFDNRNSSSESPSSELESSTETVLPENNFNSEVTVEEPIDTSVY
ncbi:LCP family protein [Macrococcoides canis]|uniref:LCP family protein n=1 Tax=Macrococcoides canis TaxID=1855823 RepID=UPI0020B64449|nr:LCP family protein [Macrococcus canis]UTH00847.1 LCP family protein [Macrococcus canis]